MGFRNLVPHMSAFIGGGEYLYPKSYTAGGETAAVPTYCQDTDVYAMLQDTWTSLTSLLTTARGGAAAASYSDGVFFSGGLSAGVTYEDNMDRYDPYVDSWGGRTDMTSGTAFHASFEAGGEIYVAAGQTGSYVLTTEGYDPDADSWSSGPDIRGLAREGVGGDGASDGNGYCIGGYTGAVMTADCDRYEPAGSGTWTSMVDGVSSRSLRSVHATTFGVAALGGDSAVSTPAVDSEVWNVATNSRSSLSDLGEVRADAGGSPWHAWAYMYGGADSGSDYSTDCIGFDVGKDTELSRTNLVAPGRRFNASATLRTSSATGPRLYAVGGTGADGIVNERYSPLNDSWSTLDSIPGGPSYDLPVCPLISPYLYVTGSAILDMMLWNLNTEAWSTGEDAIDKQLFPFMYQYSDDTAFMVYMGYDTGTGTTVAYCNTYTVATTTWADSGDSTEDDRYYGGYTSDSETGQGYCFLGREIAGAATLDYVSVYTQSGNTWASGTARATAGRACSAFILDSKSYVVCDSALLNDNDEYDDTGGVGTWTGKTNVPAPNRIETGSTNLEQFGYVLGGSGEDDDTDRYQPVSDTWISVSNMPGNRDRIGGATET